MEKVKLRHFQRKYNHHLQQVPIILTRQTWEKSESGKKVPVDTPVYIVAHYTPELEAQLSPPEPEVTTEDISDPVIPASVDKDIDVPMKQEEPTGFLGKLFGRR